jgi:predicted ATPase
MREAIAIIAATGEAIQRQYLLCVLARACGESGEASEGLNLLERALEIARSGAKYQFPELLRAKGDLLLRLNPHDDAAENWLRRALMAARDEGTKSLELRAALSLARLYRAHHREREARDVLAPVYAWFTEGFATRDLVQAKDLLDQLH